MLILDLLDLLKTETDENHRLSQKKIAEILSSRYGDDADRKTIRRNLMMLSDAGCDISHSERNRKDKNGEEEAISSEWYYNHDFTEAELRLLIDSLLFSKAIPYSQCKELIEKLRSLSSRYFNARVSYIRNLPENQPVNRQLFYTIDILDEAIGKKKQVAFNYCEYKTDLKMHRKLNAEGKVREYVINPYQIVATNGRYYLICNYDKYDNVSYYRLERITDIRLLDSPVKPLKSLKGYENGIDLPTHMAEHIYMMSGESSRVKFKADQCIVTEIIDWFGKDVKFSDETNNEVTVTVKVNEKAMFYWLMQYGEYVEVLEPKTLRKRVAETAKAICGCYGKEDRASHE